MIQPSCSRIRTVPRLFGSRLAANNAGYFAVTSSLEASPKATQLPDSAHSSDGFLTAGISRQHPPSLPPSPTRPWPSRVHGLVHPVAPVNYTYNSELTRRVTTILPPGEPGGAYPLLSPPQLRFKNLLRGLKTRNAEACDDPGESTSRNR